MAPASSFSPAKDIPNLINKVICITGGTAGLGEQSILALAAKNPAQIIFTGRNETAAKNLIERVNKESPNAKIEFVPADLTSLDSVAEASRQIKQKVSRLDLLITNAGIMATPAGTTKDGYELQFGTNHVGHALMIKMLLPVLKETKKVSTETPRIVSLTSTAYALAPSKGIEFDTLLSAQDGLRGSILPTQKWGSYGQSKLANLLYARELAKRNPDILSVSVHPGFIKTGLFEGKSFLTILPMYFIGFGKWVAPSEGAYNQLWASTTAESNLTNGAYYEPVATKPKSTFGKHIYDDELAKKLYDWTEQELAKYEA